MSHRVRLVFASVSLIAGCSGEFQVLEPHVRGPMEIDAGDAAAAVGGDAAVLDARVPREDAAARDAMTGPEAGAPNLQLALSGFMHTCGIYDRALWCWGRDEDGQVGIPGDRDQRRPVRISRDQFLDVCSGERHSCALREDGTLFCWGGNAYGELGLGDTMQREEPTALEGKRFAAIACGGLNTCAIGARGELSCWGDNLEGKLAQADDDPSTGAMGTLASSSQPLAVRSDLRFEHVSVGQGHVCAISDQRRLFCWGRNNHGQLGIVENLEQVRAPSNVNTTLEFVAVAAGQRHTCAVDVAGKLWCWGENEDGLLGFQTDLAVVRTPTQVGTDSDYATVTANWFHSCAVKKNRALVCWGRNEEGQLGQGDSMTRLSPTRVGDKEDWLTVSAAKFHTCAFASVGLWCWGANDAGQLGFGDTARRYIPARVPNP